MFYDSLVLSFCGMLAWACKQLQTRKVGKEFMVLRSMVVGSSLSIKNGTGYTLVQAVARHTYIKYHSYVVCTYDMSGSLSGLRFVMMSTWYDLILLACLLLVLVRTSTRYQGGDGLKPRLAPGPFVSSLCYAAVD